MKLELEIGDKATERLTALYLKRESLEDKYTDTMKRDVEEYASRMLEDCIRARYKAL